MKCEITVDPKDVYESLNLRQMSEKGTWNDFLQHHNIELIPQIDSCIMESKGKRFVICDDPSSSRSLKISQELAANIVGNPYFDKQTTDSDYIKIDNILKNLDENSKNVIQLAEEFGSGDASVQILLPVSLDCDWNGDPWNPDVTTGELNLRNVVEDDIEDVANKAKENVLEKVAEYKKLVQNISYSLKISSYDVHKYIMGWL